MHMPRLWLFLFIKNQLSCSNYISVYNTYVQINKLGLYPFVICNSINLFPFLVRVLSDFVFFTPWIGTVIILSPAPSLPGCSFPSLLPVNYWVSPNLLNAV